jgi:hypothetical protein
MQGSQKTCSSVLHDVGADAADDIGGNCLLSLGFVGDRILGWTE